MGWLDRTSLTYRRGGRWLAVLLAALLAMTALSSHGAMENHQSDCGVAAPWMLDDGQGSGPDGAEHDHGAASCATCSTTMGQALLPLMGPERQASSLAMALSPQIPLPPKRPPRA